MLKHQSDVAYETMMLLDNLVEKYNVLKPSERMMQIKKIKELEHKGDRIVHALTTRLDQSFITPIDKEDLHNLATLLDDITDDITTLSARLILLNLPATTPQMKKFCSVIIKMITEVRTCVYNLEKFRNTREHAQEVHKLEHEADELFQEELYALFKKKKNAFSILQYKEIYEHLERLADTCDHAMRTIETIMVKND